MEFDKLSILGNKPRKEYPDPNLVARRLNELVEREGREEELRNKLEKKKEGKVQEEKRENSLAITSNINPINYLKISGTNFCIAKIEEDWTKKLNYENSHRKVLEKGLQIPELYLFMKDFTNIATAYHNSGDVYQADGNKISREELENIYKHFTTNHINGGAWTWLNAKFVSGSGFNNLDLETITGLDGNGNLTTKREPLKECLMEDSYVDLEFNSQGLAVKKSKNQKYIQGKNIYFYHPRENCVARFGACSGRSGLDCGRGPSNSDVSLGVRCVFGAEGAEKNYRRVNKINKE